MLEYNNDPATMLHKRLKAYRTASGLTQGQVATSLEVERSTYTYYELGRSQPSLEILSRLAVIFGVPLSSLLGLEGTPSPIGDGGMKPTDEPELPSEDEISSKEPIPFNTLSRDEQNLIIKFRFLPKNQREELLTAFGLTPYNRTKKKKQ